MRLIALAFAAIAGAYLLIVALAAWRQDDLLYMPSRAALEDVSSPWLRPWPAADDLRGLVAAPEQPTSTAIVFHGNAGHVGHRAYYAATLAPLGVRVILAEYPGYGPRDGPLGERAFVADAIETVARARRTYDGPLVLIGESLGAAVASAAAAHHAARIDGVIVITPWDNLANVAAHHYGLFPVRWLLRDRYDSVEHLRSLHRPVFVAVAEHDTVVPSRFGLALYESLRGPKRLTVMRGTGHNDWIGHVDQRWWREAIAFVLGSSEGGVR